jgi:hypothetical protein
MRFVNTRFDASCAAAVLEQVTTPFILATVGMHLSTRSTGPGESLADHDVTVTVTARLTRIDYYRLEMMIDQL